MEKNTHDNATIIYDSERFGLMPRLRLDSLRPYKNSPQPTNAHIPVDMANGIRSSSPYNRDTPQHASSISISNSNISPIVYAISLPPTSHLESFRFSM